MKNIMYFVWASIKAEVKSKKEKVKGLQLVSFTIVYFQCQKKRWACLG